jgi:hypothetical protein
VDSADILGVQQIRPIPGTVLSTLKVEVDPENLNKADVSAQLHKNLSSGFYRTKDRWYDRKKTLAKRIEKAVQAKCNEDVAAGSDPPYEVDYDAFEWPDDLKSQVMPIDPWKIGLRKCPT